MGLQKGTNKQSQTHLYVRFSTALICGSHAKVNIQIYLITQRLQISSKVSSLGHYTETKKNPILITATIFTIGNSMKIQMLQS